MGEKKTKTSDIVKKDDYSDIFSYALNELNKEYKQVAYILGSGFAPTEVKNWVPTGSTLLDMIISNRPDGGWPVGKVVEIFGEESTGKSFLADLALVNTQRMGGLAILIDTESSRDPEWMKMMGMDLEKLLYFQPDYLEDTLDILEKLVAKITKKQSEKVVTIVVDSVAGARTKAESAIDYETTPKIAEKARLISMAMRRITGMTAHMNVCLIFTNQVRYKIGVMFGDPMTTPGGKGLPFASSVRLVLTRKGKEENHGLISAVGVKAHVRKNRVGPPLRTTHFMIYFNEGIRDEEDWIDVLLDHGEIQSVRGGSRGTSYKISLDGVPEDEWPKIPKKEWYETLKGDKKLHSIVKKKVIKILTLKPPKRIPINVIVEKSDADEQTDSSDNSES